MTDGQPGDFKNICETLRAQLKDFAPALVQLKNDTCIAQKHALIPEPGQPEPHDYGEMIANLTLAFRHIEDASMRIGKAIQAYDGGKSSLETTMQK